jgi:hypothetical protein
MRSKTGTRSQKSTRSIVLKGLLLSCLLANLFSAFYYKGGFTPWQVLPAPPSPAVHILDSDQENVWVQTSDGQAYSLTLSCRAGSCFQWLEFDPAEEITPMQYGQPSRGDNCASLNRKLIPFDPPFQPLQECSLSPSAGEWGHDTYFALLTDGRLMYWTHRSGRLTPPVLLLISTLGIPLAVAPVLFLLVRKG